MTALVLDAGALIQLDRNDRSTWALLRVAADASNTVHVPTGAIAQAWRDGRRQVLLARALSHCDEVALEGPLARAAGVLCGKAATADVIDASIAVTAAGLARDDQVVVVTSDRADLRHLLAVLDVEVRLIEV